MLLVFFSIFFFFNKMKYILYFYLYTDKGINMAINSLSAGLGVNGVHGGCEHFFLCTFKVAQSQKLRPLLKIPEYAPVNMTVLGAVEEVVDDSLGMTLRDKELGDMNRLQQFLKYMEGGAGLVPLIFALATQTISRTDATMGGAS